MSDKKDAKLPLSEKDLAFWRTEIKSARQKREEVADAYGWDDNLKRYIPKPAKDGNGKLNTDVNIGADFRDVERKKAALFYDTPEVGLGVTQDRELPVPEGVQLPQPLMLSTLVSWQQDLLNTLLGPQHANIKPTVLKAIFDCLCPAGVGPVTVGYQVTMKTIEQMDPVLDPITQQPVMEPTPITETIGAALGVLPPPIPKPLMQPVKVEIPIHERWFVSRSSPMALLIPASFRDTDFQRAPWLGKDFRKPSSQIRREYHLPKDWKGGTADDQVKTTFEDPHDTQVDEEAAGDPYVTGSEIYYRKQLRTDQEVHPDALMHLVLLDGQDEPLVHRPCPYQDFDEETGEMSPDSLKGFVDRPLVLRDLSDSAWIPSDCSVTGALTKELDKYRSQIIQQRDTNSNVILFDSGAIDPTAKDKIVKGPGGTWVPVKEGALAQGKDNIMAQAAQVVLGRESFMGQDYIERDRERILGIGDNQTGMQTKSRKTATEQTIVQRNSEARFEQERQRVLEWFLDVVAAFDTLILRYADERIATQILGEARGTLWAQFKSHLAGGYGYTLQVDSGKYMDVEADRRQILQFYGQVRQDPFINPRLILKDIAEKFGYDQAEFIVEPKPPEKDLKAAISIKGEDLNPLNPAFAIMVELARQGGWQISEESVQLAQQQAMAAATMQPAASGVAADPNAKGQPEHPGMAPKAPTINQHVIDESGDRSGPKVQAGGVM